MEWNATLKKELHQTKVFSVPYILLLQVLAMVTAKFFSTAILGAPLLACWTAQTEGGGIKP